MNQQTIVKKIKALNVPVYIDSDSRINAHCEDLEGYLHIDYYGEFRGGYAYISLELEQIAKDAGCYWEWNNAASICMEIN